MLQLKAVTTVPAIEMNNLISFTANMVLVFYLSVWLMHTMCVRPTWSVCDMCDHELLRFMKYYGGIFTCLWWCARQNEMF